jgi:hypothetical protein
MEVYPVTNNSLSIANTAQTYGWDTVFAIHIADANAAIAKAGSSPPSFNAEDAADGYSVQGKFGAWQIVPGGSGELIRLSIPFNGAVVTKPDKTSECANGSALVDVRLNFLDQDLQPTTGSNKTLKVQTTPAGTEQPAASVVQVNYDGTSPSFLVQAAFQGMLDAWLNANLQDFDHVFATVNINRTADEGAFQWMQPTHVSYAYSDLGSSSDGLLGVLCMTEQRSSAGLAQQVSGVVIPAGQRAALLISKERLLSNLLLPSMPLVFAGAKPTDFALSSSGGSIVNATNNVTFTVQPDKKKDTTYPAKIIDLIVTVEAQELQMSVTTETEVSSGIRAYCQTQNFLAIQLVDREDGAQTLAFSNSRPAVTNHWTEEDEGQKITDDILNICALLLAAVSVVVTDGADIGAAALIVGLVAGISNVSTLVIEDVEKNKAPAIDSLVLNSTASIAWSDSKDFLLGTACLNDSLQLGGTTVS